MGWWQISYDVANQANGHQLPLILTALLSLTLTQIGGG